MSGRDGLLVRDVELEGTPGQDCLVLDGVVAAVGTDLRHPNVVEVAGRGGALLPGLADHHLHLFAMAAAAQSFDLSEHDDIGVLGAFNVPGRWVRVLGWDEARHGDLDRDRLDCLTGERPVRVQHRSGALWVLNSAGLRAVIDAAGEPPAGAEEDEAGRLTGRLWRADRWLRDAIGMPPKLGDIAQSLSRFGVTAVTDATPDHDARAVQHLIAAVADGELPQRIQLTCADVPAELPSRIRVGPRKLVVADHELPDLTRLISEIATAHGAGRAVAVHCVSREALALTLAAFHDAGTRPGDRIEHCAIADRAAVAELASLDLTVVTQPSLVTCRGDRYLSNHDPAEHDDLWRYASLLDAGVATVASSDAPYGDPDPWATIRAARDRTTASGAVLGADERVSPERTLAGFLAPLDRPSGPPRRVAVGEPADLVLLKAPLSSALAESCRELVAVTVTDGRITYRD